MTLDDLVNSITPDIYDRLKRAVEIGKWDNGQMLSKEQREQCLQAIIAYDDMHKSESDRVGYIAPKTHDACDLSLEATADEWQKVRFPSDE